MPEAKERLRQVQEVLAEREFRIGKFYFTRESYAAAIARLQSLVDAYPLYSGADEALYMLGETYQMQAEGSAPSGGANEVAKANMIRKLEDQAAISYARIITRYPATARNEDAIAKLKSMNRAVPTPTAEAIAQSKAEEASRGQDASMVGRIMGNFKKGPDVAHAATIGEPTLEDPKPTNATDVLKNQMKMADAELSGTVGLAGSCGVAGAGATGAGATGPRVWMALAQPAGVPAQPARWVWMARPAVPVNRCGGCRRRRGRFGLRERKPGARTAQRKRTRKQLEQGSRDLS